MKRHFLTPCVIAALAATATSCLKEDKVETSPLCAIQTFTIGDFTSPYPGKTAAGKDTTYTRTISGSSVYFNIDQVNNVISSVDSLAYWADISRLVPTISFTGGAVYCREKGSGQYSYFTSGSDSIDFNKQMEFMVVATDGMSTKTYTARIDKAKASTDSLFWTEQAESTLQLTGEHKTVALGRRIYVFADNGGQTTVTTALADGPKQALEWTAPQTLGATGAAVVYSSVVPFKGSLYALDTDGHLCKATDTAAASGWTQVSDKTFDRLLTADSTRLYAYDGTEILATDGLGEWNTAGTADTDSLPASCISTACYNAKTNSQIQNVVMLGLPQAGGQHAQAWFKISSADDEIDQPWTYINISADNSYAMPSLDHLCMVRIDQALYAFGGRDLNESTAPAGRMYRSDDNGVTWHRQDTKTVLPDSFVEQAADHAFTAVAVEGRIWLIQEGGRVWCGHHDL